MYVDGLVENVPATLLVDTGSSVTLLISKFAHKLVQLHNVSLTVYPSSTTLRAVNNSPVPVSGECTISLSVGNLVVKHQVIIADIGPDVLLGIDFLWSHGCTLDFASKLLLAGDKSIPLKNLNSGNHSVFCVKLVDSVTLPPYSQIIVPGKIQSEGVHALSAGMLEPSKKFVEKYNVAMAGVVVTPDLTGRVPIRLQNLLSTPTTIAKHYEVAQFDCDVDVDENENEESVNVCNAVREGQLLGEPLEKFNLRHLSADNQSRVSALLKDNVDIISTGQFDLGKTDEVTHTIETESDRPKRQAPRRIPLHRRGEVKEHIEQLLNAEVITPSNSPLAAPIVVVRKPDSSIRLCVDYRQLNAITKKDAFPMPRVDDAIDAMAGARYLSTVDLASGYWQVELNQAAKAKSAFVTPFGLYEWNRMPFGLCNAPSTFQRLMNKILGILFPSFVWCILMILLCSHQHLMNISLVYN